MTVNVMFESFTYKYRISVLFFTVDNLTVKY